MSAAIVISDSRRPRVLGVALAVVGILLASMTGQALATRHMNPASREPEVLQQQVLDLFDQLDQLSQTIEKVQADIASTRRRMTELLRQIASRQRLLDRRAAEAYMSLPTVGVETVLGANSFIEVQDALQFLDAVSRRDQDVLRSLLRRKTEMELQRALLEGLEAELRGERERLEATVADLVEKLQRQRTLLRHRAEEPAQDDGSVNSSTPPAPPTSQAPPTPPLPNRIPGPRAVTELIRKHFASLGARTGEVALCVARRESNLDPLAVNPSTGASGLFQFLPSTWSSLSDLAGWGGASVFEARANAAVAAWTVAHYGWHPWRSVAADCRA